MSGHKQIWPEFNLVDGGCTPKAESKLESILQYLTIYIVCVANAFVGSFANENNIIIIGIMLAADIGLISILKGQRSDWAYGQECSHLFQN